MRCGLWVPVTFLFASIQDSLRRWDEAPTEMAAGQRVHDAIVRDAIEGHGGHLFATDRDGFCAAFSTAASVAEAAVEAQRKLRADATIGFAVRMGCTPGRRWSVPATTPGAGLLGRGRTARPRGCRHAEAHGYRTADVGIPPGLAAQHRAAARCSAASAG